MPSSPSRRPSAANRAGDATGGGVSDSGIAVRAAASGSDASGGNCLDGADAALHEEKEGKGSARGLTGSADEAPASKGPLPSGEMAVGLLGACQPVIGLAPSWDSSPLICAWSPSPSPSLANLSSPPSLASLTSSLTPSESSDALDDLALPPPNRNPNPNPNPLLAVPPSLFTASVWRFSAL